MNTNDEMGQNTKHIHTLSLTHTNTQNQNAFEFNDLMHSQEHRRYFKKLNLCGAYTVILIICVFLFIPIFRFCFYSFNGFSSKDHLYL